jgi:hypothetical protein
VIRVSPLHAVPGLPQPGRTLVIGVVNVTQPPPSVTALTCWPKVRTSSMLAASQRGLERLGQRCPKSCAG